MSSQAKTYLKFGGATAVIILLLGYLAYTGVQDSKSYYVTIKELHRHGQQRLREAPARCRQCAARLDQARRHPRAVRAGGRDQTLAVDYTGTEAPPDTFKDDSQALADGSFGHDGVFHAKALQAKCASKYAPKQPGDPTNGTPSAEPAKSMTQAQPAVDPERCRTRIHEVNPATQSKSLR